MFIHVLAASVWVGGQLTLLGLLPTLRGLGADAPRAAARSFGRVAWASFGVLIISGVWNILDTPVGDRSTEYQVTLFVKLVVVAASGIAAFVHGQGRSKLALALGGAVGLLSSLVALFLGLLLVG